MNRHLFPFLIAAFALIYSASASTKSPISQAVKLRVDYQVDPITINTAVPQFSWQIRDLRKGARQTSYRILVASSVNLLAEGRGDIWDSGKRKSSKNNQISYSGKRLESSSRYYWKVQLWDLNGKITDFSEIAFFETTYFNLNDWKGQWITSTEDTTSKSAPLFRKVIVLKEKPVRATAYVAGVGYHELYINNQKVSNSFLEPGYTRFDRRILYIPYDVTSFISKGSNGVGVILGNGWLNVQTKAVWDFEKAPWRVTPRLLVDIRLEYEDGSVEWISTDSTWKTSDSPIRFNSLYAGEEYDARLEQPGWSDNDFNDESWKPVLVTNSPGGVLTPQTLPPIKVVREIQPVHIHQLGSGRFLFDMGENFAGVPRLKVRGEKGTKITMRFGELINSENLLDNQGIAVHMRIPEDEQQFQTDIYTLKGEGEEIYIPRFTYHGYQYVEVITEPAIELTTASLEGLFLSTGFEEIGSFNSSNELLNKLYEATLQSYLSNFHSIPTDCPHREKNGWTGDAHIACELGLWNYDGIQVYRKWLQDFRDEQRETGELPGIMPTSGWGYQWGNGPAWDSALPIIAWTLYQFYGDTIVLSENYDAIKKYVDYLGTRTETGIQTFGLGDWVSIVNTPTEITSTAYYYHDAKLLAEMARLLKKPVDQKKYSSLAQNIKKVFNETFMEPSLNHYKTQTQTALSCAVYQGLVPDGALNNTINDLVQQVTKNNYHPDFGLLGSKYVLNVLHESGNDEIAYKMVNNTKYPSWGYWIAQGATTLWEDWDGGTSRNHVFLGDFTSWFYKALGGIQIDPMYPGFDRFIIKPSFINDLTNVECSHNSIHGKIVSNWKRLNNQIEMEIVIPANSEAVVNIPALYKIGSVLEKGKKIAFKSTFINQRQTLSLGAGHYILIFKEG